MWLLKRLIPSMGWNRNEWLNEIDLRKQSGNA